MLLAKNIIEDAEDYDCKLDQWSMFVFFQVCGESSSTFFLIIVEQIDKSIANYRNRSKSKITKTGVIDFYRLPMLIDWLVSITIDYVRFLPSIENID